MRTMLLASLFMLGAILLLLFLFAGRSANAADPDSGSGCRFEWTVTPDSASRIIGYRLTVNSTTKELPAMPLSLPCTEAGLVTGANKVRIRALGNGVISPPSNEVAFNYDPRALAAPTFKIVIEVPK